VLTLYQAEWCPYSSAVREVLTELGLDFVVRQVEPEPDDRAALRELAGDDSIPVLQTEDGELHRGTRAIFRYLESQPAWEHAEGHRRRFREHADARESDAMGKLVERFGRDRPGEPVVAEPADAEVVDRPELSRYELRLGDRRVGLAAYRRRDDRIAFTHTEIDSACEGRGFGTKLVHEALDDARRRGLTIVPLCPFVAAFVKRHPEYVS
jgi:predicted GNAT family acetyltransferase/glutaredoxin